MSLQEGAKFFNGQPSIPHNTPHRDCMDRIVPGNSEDAHPIRHDNMFALPDNAKASFLKRPHSVLVIDPRQLGHRYTTTSTSRTSASGVP